MKQRLSAIFLAASAASLLLASTSGIAAHKMHENYKAEANFKAECPPPCPPVLVLHDGFYLGVGVGYDSYRSHVSGENTFIDADGTIEEVDSSSAPLSATGWMGGIFAGYGRYFDTFYIGLEINANTSNADAVLNSSDSFGDSDYAKFRARSSYGIAILPGIKINDSTLLYARLGWLRTNFHVNVSETDFDTDSSTFNTFEGSESNWRNGFNYGIGIESAVAENVSIRGEFTHTSFNNKTVSGTAALLEPGDFVNFDDRFTLSNNEFMFSVIYHFC